jgi:hypothetical protein
LGNVAPAEQFHLNDLLALLGKGILGHQMLEDSEANAIAKAWRIWSRVSIILILEEYS